MFDYELSLRSQRLRDMISTVVEFLPGQPAPADQGNATPLNLVTAREAAKVLGVCEKTLWSIANRGEIPVVRIGRSVRYDPRDLARWVEANKSPATGSARVV